ncbi:M42 family metallopeptidase [Exiguobacterium aestuarii]|uniref:M42 family metallopeptidase n=1 Tax=Exiguobacterium aestuarii TaxID=273527 RepID=A0ABW2PJ37_9BACL|nr:MULTISPECIES: M42 family metallopeptidase [Exiguobacterium]MCT4786445.1 M42 family metallopeptidase [Exiguobacterium aestuarii]
MNESLHMLKRLTDATGVPGNEGEVRQLMREYLEPHVESFEQDGLGSLFGQVTGDTEGPRVMIAGHMDEVGFMVTRIEEGGFLRFQALGGWWNQVLLAQRMDVVTRSGEKIPGVIGAKPPHVLPLEARKKPVEIKDMFLDIGATSKDEVAEWGIRPGDTVVPHCEFTVMKNENFLMAKAWDNRIGCAIAIEAAKRLKEESFPGVVFTGATVQEEVGLRGAVTAANLIQPDVAIAVDTGIPSDTPGMTPAEGLSKLGDGVQVIFFDATTVTNPRLVDLIVDVAKENDIKYQLDLTPGGGTDAGRFHLSGIGMPAIALTVPVRYLHTNVSIIHKDDYEAAIELVVALTKRLDHETVQWLKEG